MQRLDRDHELAEGLAKAGLGGRTLERAERAVRANRASVRIAAHARAPFELGSAKASSGSTGKLPASAVTRGCSS